MSKSWQRLISDDAGLPPRASSDPFPDEGEALDAFSRVVDRLTVAGYTVDRTARTVSYGELGPGRVQVEFGKLTDENDLDEARGASDLSDAGGTAGRPEEEGPDGH